MSNINVGTVTLTSGLRLPSFTNSNRPTGVEGLMIYNSEKQTIQAYISGEWNDVGGGGKKLVEFKLWGAGGGSGSQQRSNTNYHTNTFYNIKEGGAGGFVTASFKIASGTSLVISVGGGGKGGLIGGNPSDAQGGYNGGGGGSYTTYDASGGGGGYSGVFIGSKTQANALVIAPGGGGGAGGPGYPGSANDEANGGGGIATATGVGNAGRRSYGYHVAYAGGGTTTSGGVGGDSSDSSGDGAAGSVLQGGNAVHYRNAWGSGGGGGGGWYGGGSGSNDGNSWSGGGGGAGSAFVRESGIATAPTNSDIVAVEYVNHTFGLQTFGAWGNGSTPGYGSMRMPTGTGDANYPGGSVGYGGAFRLINQGGPAGYNGENGAIIYRIASGAWTSVAFSGSDITIIV